MADTQEATTDPIGDTKETPVVDANDKVDAKQQFSPPLEPATTEAPITLAFLQE